MHSPIWLWNKSIVTSHCLQSWKRQWQPTPVLLPGESHGWRSLVGCSPWGHYESDMTKWLHFHALEKEMAAHSSVLAWRIQGTREPGGLLSMGLHRVEHNWSDLAAAAVFIPVRTEVIFSFKIHTQFQDLYGNTKNLELPKQSWEIRMELEESTCLTSGSTTKPQSSK